MKLVVGLGNPGSRYELTRHNAGFWVAERLAGRFCVSFRRKASFLADVAEARMGLLGGSAAQAQLLIIAKPQTYMNLSGQSVRAITDFYGLGTEDVVVVFDDIDLAPGRVRIRASGAAGGHKGMASILAHLGTNDIPRVRVGVGRPSPGMVGRDFVLSQLSRDDTKVFAATVELAAAAVETVLTEGVAVAMNRYNGAVAPGVSDGEGESGTEN